MYLRPLILYLQTFKNNKDLVGFCVIVQTYWWLKVDGSHVILNGDVAPPEGSLGFRFGKTPSKYAVTYLLPDFEASYSINMQL